jgi:hypothetical protein
LDEFCSRRKRIEKRHLDYARNSYHDEFINFPPRTFSCASPSFFHGPNHHSYVFGSQENRFVPKCFGYGSRPHRGDRPPRRHGFPGRGAYSHFKPSHFDYPRFPCYGSHPTHSNDEVQRIVKTSSGHMIKCWILKIFLTNPSTEPSTFSHSM